MLSGLRLPLSEREALIQVEVRSGLKITQHVSADDVIDGLLAFVAFAHEHVAVVSQPLAVIVRENNTHTERISLAIQEYSDNIIV